ncbi:MAG: hypothetical protein RJB34_1615 [Pseudomonadota bacterium]|jgi:GT2 family glycosyltransferase
MDLSIVIVTYNSASLIDALLQRLHAELRTLGSSLQAEVWVVDNHSRDGTADLVAQSHPWVRLLRSDTNLGFASGNNWAAGQASGRFLLLLNPDALPDAGTLLRGVQRMSQHPNVGMGGGLLRNTDNQAQPSARMFPKLWDEWASLSGMSAKHPKSRLWSRMDRGWADDQAVADVDWIPGAFVFIRAEVFAKLGGFDPRFFLYYEEVDFCRTLHQHGWKVRYWPELQAQHIGGASAKTIAQGRVSAAGSQLELWRMRSALLYHHKWHGPYIARLHHLIEWSWFALRRRKAMWREQHERVVDLTDHIALLEQAWSDTLGGAVSPPRPW